MIDLVFKRSCKWGANISDWIRSVYFSLLGSSVLNFALKWYSISLPGMILYILALVLFAWGLAVAVRITNEFKIWEKDYERSSTIKNVSRSGYLELKEEKKKTEHFVLYTIWIPAVIAIGFVGYGIESKSAVSSNGNKAVLDGIGVHSNAADSGVRQTISGEKELKDKVDSILRILNKKDLTPP
jgi:hypothetical protein